MVLRMAKTVSTVTVPREGRRGGDPAASVYHASFTKVMFSNLYGISVSNILIFMLGASPAFLGVASALNALAYFAGPILFHGMSKRAGIKRTFFTISIVDLAILLLAACIPHPAVIITVFIIAGFTSCIFWANMAATIRAWQEITPTSYQRVIYRRYGASWIAGGLASEVLGLVMIATGFDDRLVLATSILIAVIQLPISRRVSLPPRAPAIKESKEAARAAPRKARPIGRLLVTPLVLIVVAEIAVQMIRGTYDFLYPFIVREDGGSTWWIYLMSLVQRLAFMSGIHASSKQGPRGQYVGAMMGLGVAIVLSMHVISSPVPFIFAIALLISDFATGLIYGFSSQALLRYGDQGNALRYAALYETASGAGYGITVIVAGLVGEHNTRPIFIGLSAFLALAFTLFVLTSLKGSNIFHRSPGKSTEFLAMARARLFRMTPSTVHSPASSHPSRGVRDAILLLDTAKK